MTVTTSAISYIPSLIRQPTTVAVLASLGLHALFALNLENIRLYPNTVQLPPSVELVELSSSQIDRVFPAPPPQFSFTPFPEPPSLPMWGSAPPPSPFPPSAQQLPVFPSTLPQPRDNPFSAIPSRPPQIFNNPSNGTFLPPVPTSPPPPTQFSPPPPIEFYQTPPGQPSFPGNQNREQLSRLQNNPRFSHLSPEEQRLLEEQFSMLPPPPPRPRFPEHDPSYNQPPRIPRESQDSAEPTQEFTPETEVQQPDGRGSILARLEADNQRRAETVGSRSSDHAVAPSSPTGEISDSQYAMLEGGGAYVEWVLSMLPDYPDLNTSQPRTISALYPAEACEQNLTGHALVGVMIGSGGDVIAGPQLLRGTGYPILDDAAITAIADISFEGQGRPIAYQYAFNFDSQNCQSVAPAPAPAPATSPELAPESIPEPEPQPQPQPQQEFNPELAPESVPEPETQPQSKLQPEPQPEPEVHSGSILQQLQHSLENPDQFSEEFID